MRYSENFATGEGPEGENPLTYAKRGYPVFPCRLDKAPATTNGLRAASTDPDVISKWANHPGPWGLLPPVNVIVLDADTPEAAARLEQGYSEVRGAPKCRTPRGGAHFYFRWPDNLTAPPTRAGALPDVDIRGFGKAYVVVPPSKTERGVYMWVRPLTAPGDLPLISEALGRALSPKPKAPPGAPTPPLPSKSGKRAARYAEAALNAECQAVAAAPEGQRNQTLYRAALALGGLVAGGALERGQVEIALLAAAGQCGLLHDESLRTIASGLGAGAENPRSIPAPRAGVGPAHSGEGDTEKVQGKSVATRLVELATAEVTELWHDPDGEPYATLEVGGHLEHYPLRQKTFRAWLERLYYNETRRAANAQAVQDALGTLAGIARFEGCEYAVHTRLARLGERLYLDLANEQWRVVEIGPTGWRVLNTAPVKFRRPKGMLPLPTPVEGGDIRRLREFVNVEDAAWPLVLGWLVACYAPTGPYPVLVLTAEQGSGKSTTAQVLRALIDPNLAPLRSEPRDDRDLMIAAKHGAVVMLDNLSPVSVNLSDSLCRLATGAGLGTRELYSNDDEVLFAAARPVLLTGIEELATRGDLLDRSILAGCPRLEGYRTERELWQSFGQAAPPLLGALLTAVSTGLKNLPTTTLPNLPRMADATLWVSACEPALGFTTGTFANAYLANRREAHDLALEVSPLPGRLRDLLTGKETWEGTATELLSTLTSRVDDATKHSKGWPKTPRALTNASRRLAPNLRATGLEVDFARTGARRLIRIRAIPCVTTVSCVTNAVPDAKCTVTISAPVASPIVTVASPGDASDADGLDIVTAASITEVRPGQHNDASDASDAEIPNHSDEWEGLI